MFAAPRASAVLHYWCMSYIPLKQRIHFKILLFAFKTIHGIAPTYIQKPVPLKSQGAYNLKSSGGILIASPTFRTKVTLCDRSFQVNSGSCRQVMECSTAQASKHSVLNHILLRAILRRISLSLLIVKWILIVTYRYFRLLL